MSRVSRAALFITFALGLAACGGQGAGDDGPIPTQGVVNLSEQFSGEFSLIDKNSQPVSREDFAGKVMVVYFGFTHCPDVCPGDVGVMSAALNELGEDVDEVAPVFISVDPERDTPDALKDYFGFDERIVALTGGPEASAAAQNAFKVFAQKQPLPDSALVYTIDHSRFYYIADREGQPRLAVVGGVSAQELAALLRRSIRNF